MVISPNPAEADHLAEAGWPVVALTDDVTLAAAAEQVNRWWGQASR